MRPRLAAAILSAVVPAASPAAAAEAASLAVFPIKSCYRSGEAMAIGGTGYTPNGQVRISSGGAAIGNVGVDANGGFLGKLTVRQTKGASTKTYIATDVPDPRLSAFIALRVSAVTVDVSPDSPRPGRPLLVKARGFTIGKTLYAHVLRGRRSRNVRLGRVRGPCGDLSVRRKIFTRNVRGGRYAVQYDTRARYSRRTAVKLVVRYRVNRGR